MSLIYDALRKSEEQRRAGELPSLSTPPTWRPSRRPPSRWPLIAGAAFVVALAAAFFGFRDDEPAPVQTAATGPGDAPAVDAGAASRADAADPLAAGTDERPADVNRRARREPGRPVATGPAPKVSIATPSDGALEIMAEARKRRGTAKDVRPATPIAAEPSNEMPADLKRKFDEGKLFVNSPAQVTPAPPTAGQAYVPPDAALPQPLADPTGAGGAGAGGPSEAEIAAAATPSAPGRISAAEMIARKANLPASAKPVRSAPATPAPQATPQTAAPAVVAARTPGVTTGAPVVGKAPVPSTSTVPTPPPSAPGIDPSLPAVPLVYELSLATRQTLPELKLNMHVYNADPARRFVIIDGTRAGEGQPLSQGLDVAEIRPDGIVLRYQGQTFLLPRGGR